MAEAVVAIVIEGIKPLGDLIVQEAKLLSGVGYQVELAQVELHLMGVFLKDADSRAGDDEVVRIWVKLIRDVAYDLEDVIESFALKVAYRKRGGTIKLAFKRFACIFNEGIDRHRIGSEIQDIMSKLSSLRSSLQSYNIRQSDPERVAALKFRKQRDRRQTYAHQVESHIIGLEESTDLLVKELMKGGKRHRVLSIWGMGGSGKTTLAKQVFLRNEVKHHFDYFAWVCISQRCEGRDVLEDILIKLTSPTDERRKQIAKMKKEEIAEELCDIQRKRRCLVVIDDIWTREAWHSLEPGFPINEETESRILITTRKKEVANKATENGYLHQPQPLNDKQSWDLFEKIAIRGSDQTDLEKKRELGKKMHVRCLGFPLAIRVLAGLLSRRETDDEWGAVLRNVDVYIMRSTNVLERENEGQDFGVSGVLELSYVDLPSHLKLCFLYLAQFPEDHEISVNRLTQLWIAEGFITSEIHGSVDIVENVAYVFLIELVERSMVQVVEYGLSGKVKTCRLHDLMRDLCLQKAKEENFLDVVDRSAGMVSRARLSGKFRRLAIYLDKEIKQEEFSSRFGRDDRIRSMLYFAKKEFYPNWMNKVICSVFNDFKLLRVLMVEHFVCGMKLPKTIGSLVHLRFLSLRNSEFVELPSSLSNLVLLQTLDLRVVPHTRKSWFGSGDYTDAKIRSVYCNMEELRHLYLPDPEFSKRGKKLSLSKLHNLQTLVNIRLDRCELNDFVQLTKLRKLGIFASKSSQLEELNEVLLSRNVMYEHLQSLSLSMSLLLSARGTDTMLTDLVLRFPYLYKLRLRGQVRELPRALLGYPNLTKIKLECTELKDDQMQVLENLPKLRVLYLGAIPIISERMVFSQGGFPHLEILTLAFLFTLKEWKVERGAMPCLRRLKIEYCYKLVEIPDGLQDIVTLKELMINVMPRIFCSRVGEGGEDFYKIKHVPSLIITNIQPDDEREMEEASRIVSDQAGDSHQESIVDAPPGENTDEIQASSSPKIPF